MFYSAKKFVERRSRRRGRFEGYAEGFKEGWREGLPEGRQAERERINREVAERGVQISPELAKILAGDAG